MKCADINKCLLHGVLYRNGKLLFNYAFTLVEYNYIYFQAGVYQYHETRTLDVFL